MQLKFKDQNQEIEIYSLKARIQSYIQHELEMK